MAEFSLVRAKPRLLPHLAHAPVNVSFDEPGDGLIEFLNGLMIACLHRMDDAVLDVVL